MAVTEIMSNSEAGMQYQKMRVEAATINIANANVVQPANGTGFKPLTVIRKSDFESALVNSRIYEIIPQDIADKKVYQPDHIAADSQGFVRFANVDMAEQMITMTQATRAYEANIKAFNAEMNMTMRAMEIGK